MRKQLVSFAQETKFFQNIKFKGGLSPPCVRPCTHLKIVKYIYQQLFMLLQQKR